MGGVGRRVENRFLFLKKKRYMYQAFRKAGQFHLTWEEYRTKNLLIRKVKRKV